MDNQTLPGEVIDKSPAAEAAAGGPVIRCHLALNRMRQSLRLSAANNRPSSNTVELKTALERGVTPDTDRFHRVTEPTRIEDRVREPSPRGIGSEGHSKTHVRIDEPGCAAFN